MGWDGKNQGANRSFHSGFNPCFDGLWVGTSRVSPAKDGGRSFNPCFDGLWVGTKNIFHFVRVNVSFNPCFDGLWVGTKKCRHMEKCKENVSILVLMDCGLGPVRVPHGSKRKRRFQSLF